MVVGIDFQMPGGSYQSDPDYVLPENYPAKYVKKVVARGREMTFRPVHPGDNDLMIRLYSAFSKQTIFHRFFTSARIPPSKLSRFTNIDYVRHMAIVSEETKDGAPMITGSARYNTPKDEEGTAEMAIVIGDPWQGNGIGTALLNYLLIVARDCGFKSVYGLVHYDNSAMVKTFEAVRAGGVPYHTADTGTELKFILNLEDPVPIFAFNYVE
ncbi:MAG TPA: GNAT family N-acetyltransferase [bacterium]|nr:GNAT family N-acetyltransferase [bacterium]